MSLCSYNYNFTRMGITLQHLKVQNFKIISAILFIVTLNSSKWQFWKKNSIGFQRYYKLSECSCWYRYNNQYNLSTYDIFNYFYYGWWWSETCLLTLFYLASLTGKWLENGNAPFLKFVQIPFFHTLVIERKLT